MEAKDLLKYCLYDKGDNFNYSEYSDIQKTFAQIESKWATSVASSNPIVDSNIDNYISSNLRTFEQYDGIPLSLKSFLFTFFCSAEGTDNIEDFKNMYLTKYRK